MFVVIMVNKFKDQKLVLFNVDSLDVYCRDGEWEVVRFIGGLYYWVF